MQEGGDWRAALFGRPSGWSGSHEHEYRKCGGQSLVPQKGICKHSESGRICGNNREETAYSDKPYIGKAQDYKIVSKNTKHYNVKKAQIFSQGKFQSFPQRDSSAGRQDKN